MIDKIGLKTTIRELVAYRELGPKDEEVAECARLASQLREAGANPKEPTMILFLDDKDDPKCRKEVMIPIEKEVEGFGTKVKEEVKVAFLLFKGTDQSLEHYYGKLYEFIEENGLTPTTRFCSIEAVYQPHEYGLSYGSFIDEDAPEHWSTEIMIPVEE
jgi:effector-binding domain-containing protein